MIYYFSLPVQGISVMPEKQKKKNKNDNHIKESFIMKLLLVCLAVLLLALAVLLLKNTLQRKKLPLQLTEKIYAVPGIECNIYFNNVVTAINYRNYAYEVRCDIGRTDSDRWRVTPEEKDIGEHKLTLIVHGDDGIVARATTTVVVAAPVTEKKKVSLLLMGASQTAAVGYPERIFELMKAEKNVDFTMVGTNSGGYAAPVPGGVAHEGYGGWKWQTFMNKYNPNATGRYKYASCSKFLFPQADGKLVFDVNKYLEKYNKGAKPDIVTFQLGVNDVFWGNKDNLDKFCADILTNADKLIAEFRKVLPNAIFGVGFVTQGADQDAFGHNYKCGQTAWDYYRNSMRLNQLMQKHFASYNDPKLFMIPVSVALDTENNFPARKIAVNSQNTNEVMRQNNGVHPAAAGYRQMGDAYYAWLKYILSHKM